MDEMAITNVLATIRWADASLEQIVARYAEAVVTVREENGARYDVTFHEHIALRQSEHWDENIIENCSSLEGTSLIKDTLAAIRSRYGDQLHGGGTKRLDDKWKHFVILLLDGSSVEIVAKDVSISTHPEPPEASRFDTAD